MRRLCAFVHGLAQIRARLDQYCYAVSAYRRVERPEDRWLDAASTWSLAQRRLAVLKPAPAAPAKPAAK